MNERGRLISILQGPWVAQACYALAKLEVPDLLADGPRHVKELAAACGAHPQALHRLLRALVFVDLLEQPEPDTFALTPVTELLRRNTPTTMHGTAIIYGEDVYRSFAEIMHPLLEGRPGFEKITGKSVYDHLDADADAARTWNASMSRNRIPDVISSCDFSTATTVVDVGGGTGRLLAQVLTDNPHLRGTLLELSTAVDQAAELIAAQGLTDRVDLVKGSFFDTVPTGGDVYVLARCLHNWNDDNALRILRQVHAAMKADSRLLVVEDLTTDDVSLIDLLMLVQLEGHDRTREQYTNLLTRAGFHIQQVLPPPVPYAHAPSAIEATAT
ncbi:methyltransferase [Longispora urticae]